MNKENWLEVCDSFRELFDILAQSNLNHSISKRFTNHELEKVNQVIISQKNYNGWFTEESIRQALSGLSIMLNPNDISKWISNYSYNSTPKKILLIMAGNIPLVGFHDLICVWLSGNYAQIKLSSDDQKLLPSILELITEIHPNIKSYFSIETGKINQSEAVIATGSDNSNLYFEKYFGHLPTLLRKNRTSIGVIEGGESSDELVNLGKDIFQFYGKGCRNVSFLLIPDNFNLNILFEALLPYYEIIHHKKYGNNYEYNRAIHLLNRVNFLDNNFLMLKETDALFSPISMVHFLRYTIKSDVDEFIEKNKSSIQIVVGRNYIPFGNSQNPTIWNYADGVDTMKWLNNLSYNGDVTENSFL
jgi:hypothetical protein